MLAKKPRTQRGLAATRAKKALATDKHGISRKECRTDELKLCFFRVIPCSSVAEEFVASHEDFVMISMQRSAGRRRSARSAARRGYTMGCQRANGAFAP